MTETSVSQRDEKQERINRNGGHIVELQEILNLEPGVEFEGLGTKVTITDEFPSVHVIFETGPDKEIFVIDEESLTRMEIPVNVDSFKLRSGVDLGEIKGSTQLRIGTVEYLDGNSVISDEAKEEFYDLAKNVVSRVKQIASEGGFSVGG